MCEGFFYDALHACRLTLSCRMLSRLCMSDPAFVSAVRSAFHECCAYPVQKLRQSAESAELSHT